MRTVTLQLFGAFSELDTTAGAGAAAGPEGRAGIQINVEGDTVADLRQALRVLLPARWPAFAAGLLDYSAFADSQRILRDPEPLPEDGRVAILPPVSGG